MTNSMMTIALSQDLKRNYLLAVDAYECIIKETSKPPLECFTNLSFIYWAFAAEENEFNYLYEIPSHMSLVGLDKYEKVLNNGLNIYPDSLEINFWSRYFSHRLYGTEFDLNQCLEMLLKFRKDTTLIPYFYINLFDKNIFKEKINALKIECINRPTAKFMYVNSFL